MRALPAAFLACYGAMRCCSSRSQLLQHCFPLHHTTHQRAAQAHSPSKHQRFRPRIATPRFPDAPGRNALLFALLHADHVFQHFVKLAAQRHPRVDHPPRHDFRARFRARVHHDHLTPRALCPLQPVRQQTIHNIHDLLLIVHNVSHRTRHLPACCAATRSSTSSSSARLRERLHARM